MLPDKEHHTLPESYLRAQPSRIAGGGGRPKSYSRDRFSSGAEDDIKRATRLARSMVAGWGMSDAIGPNRPAPKGGAPVPRPVHRAAAGVLGHDGGPCGCRGGGASERGGGPRHRDPVRPPSRELGKLVSRLEEQETLGFEEIRAVLEPGRRPARPRNRTGTRRSTGPFRCRLRPARARKEGLTARLVSPPCPKHAVGRTCHRAFFRNAASSPKSMKAG